MTRLYAGLIALLALVVLVPVSALADTRGEPINTPDRFMVLCSFNDEAVLDRETGLVWEQSPIAQGRLWSASLPSPLSVEGAQTHCKRRTLGNRKGWRLPTIQELASLVDPTVPPDAGATLPAGHPFTLFPYVYWSATTHDSFTDRAWVVDFRDGSIDSVGKSVPSMAWCVRGGQGVDPQ